MDEAMQEVVTNQLRLAGAGMALERVLYALMTAHPDPERLNQALLAELNPSKEPGTLPGACLDSWRLTAARFLDHSVTLASLAQSGAATKN